MLQIRVAFLWVFKVKQNFKRFFSYIGLTGVKNPSEKTDKNQIIKVKCETGDNFQNCFRQILSTPFPLSKIFFKKQLPSKVFIYNIGRKALLFPILKVYPTNFLADFMPVYYYSPVGTGFLFQPSK